MRAADPLPCRRQPALTCPPTSHHLPAASPAPTHYQPTARHSFFCHQRPANKMPACDQATASPAPGHPWRAINALPQAHHLPTARPPLRSAPPTNSQPVAKPALPTKAKKVMYDLRSFRFHRLNAGGFWQSRDAPHRLMRDPKSSSFFLLSARGFSLSGDATHRLLYDEPF